MTVRAPGANRVIIEWFVLGALLVALTVVASREQWFWRVDRIIYDTALGLWQRKAPNDIVIVAIDEASLDAIGRWPWRRAVHALLLQRLAAARAVGMDLILSEPDEGDPDSDAALSVAIRRHGKVVLPVLVESLPDGSLRENLPHASLTPGAASLGHIHIELDPDGIARSVYLREGLGVPSWPQLGLAMIEVAEGRKLEALPGLRKPDTPNDPRAWIRDYWMHIPFAGPPGHFVHVPYAQVLRDEMPPDFFRDKLVLVGATAAGMGDSYPVPVSGFARAMPGVEITANVIDALRSGIAVRSANPAAETIAVVVPVLLALFAFLRLAPRFALLSTALLAVVTIAASLLLLRVGQIWLAPTAAIFALIVGYPLWSWRRLEATQLFLDEQLRRIETHIRSSPVAPVATGYNPPVDPIERRIAAVRAAADRVERADHERREMLDFVAHDLRSPQVSILALLDTAEAGNRPIAATFARIDAHVRRTLALADRFVELAAADERDPRNFDFVEMTALVHEAADDAWELASKKHIALVRAIDPELHYVAGDRSLLQRAVANLIDNAIKYSMEDSTITLELRRRDGMVVVTIADQGEGIAADELPLLFERFRRARAAARSDGNEVAKGVGLGLALVKAVADRHRGRITVKSDPGHGSTFALEIPEVHPPGEDGN